jgi:hypothetical protein
MTITRKSARLTPIEMPNGAVVVCKHDMLAIVQRGHGGSGQMQAEPHQWLHAHNGQRLCRPAYGGRPAGPYVAEPYIIP